MVIGTSEVPRVRRARTAAAAATSALLALAWLAPVAFAADQTVNIQGFGYGPTTVTVSVGDTVTWTNSDGVGHTATARDDSWDTGAISGGSSAEVTFDAPGSFAYYCTIHPDMSGTVVVEAAAAAPTTPPTDTHAPAATPDGNGWLVGLGAALAGLGLALGAHAVRRGSGQA